MASQCDIHWRLLSVEASIAAEFLAGSRAKWAKLPRGNQTVLVARTAQYILKIEPSVYGVGQQSTLQSVHFVNPTIA
jgi:hypothetical protein